MPATLPLSVQDRLLVVAPHPDDETLAAGELVQAALAAGATVRVLYATDGDNNPWPQRWIEKRWRLDGTARERWAQRRRQEAAVALAALASDRAIDVRRLGWPDQGLTDALMREDASVAALRAELDAFGPTHVVMPSLHDRHPDHSALHVMLELALLRRARPCQRLTYLIHAHGEGGGIALPPDPARQARKRAAMEAYVSQLSLSRGRLLALAARMECFVPIDAPAAREHECLYVQRPRATHWRAHDFLLVLASGERTLRIRARVPRGTRMLALEAGDCALHARVGADAIEIALPPGLRTSVAWTKWHRSGARVVVFDRTPWRDVDAMAGSAPRPIDARVAAGLG
ncbi:PIG-L family deacetylase [Dokdonella sp.]|uniref:PIG-L deacetylase family protein n=1 Tax=Dokdonella sp. TaxID=2291710 RepID=UPI002F3FCFA0